VDEIVDFFKDRFEKSIIGDLRKYIEDNNYPNKFYIFSDYCLHDRHKIHDVVTYTIMPYSPNINGEKTIIGHIAPKDIKHARKINPDFINYLKKSELFHISFLLGSRDYITKRDWIEPRDYIKESLEKSMNEILTKNHCISKEYYNNLIKSFNNLKNEMVRKSSTIKLYRDIVLISLITAYIMYLLTKESNAIEIAWLSDRDKIVEAYSRITFDLCQYNHYAICIRNKVYTKDIKLIYAITEEGISYEEMNRIPDYIAGTLAEWNPDSQFVSKEKFVTVLQSVIANNNFCPIIELSLSDKELKCSRIFI
jgi:poly(3-hydroxyalkanoate) synthetase